MDLDDIITFVSVLFGGICIFAGTIFLLMVLWATWPGPLMCEAYSQGMKVKTEYKFWYGCFVTMPDGQILPESIANTILKQEYKLNIKTEERK